MVRFEKTLQHSERNRNSYACFRYYLKTLKFSISGLRGVYGTDLSRGIPQLTLAFLETIGAGPVAIGWDARPANNNFANLVKQHSPH